MYWHNDQHNQQFNFRVPFVDNCVFSFQNSCLRWTMWSKSVPLSEPRHDWTIVTCVQKTESLENRSCYFGKNSENELQIHVVSVVCDLCLFPFSYYFQAFVDGNPDNVVLINSSRLVKSSAQSDFKFLPWRLDHFEVLGRHAFPSQQCSGRKALLAVFALFLDKMQWWTFVGVLFFVNETKIWGKKRRDTCFPRVSSWILLEAERKSKDLALC